MKPIAVLLAGGESKRFGRPKCLIEINGIPILTILASEARLAGIDDMLVSGNETTVLRGFGMRVIEDIHKNCGPLAGIHSALVSSDAREILILACDTPGIKAAEIRAILEAAESEPGADVAFAASPSGNHPLCALVRHSLLPEIESAIASDTYGVNMLFTESNHVAVYFENEKPFANLNTPADLVKWEGKRDA